LKIQQSDATSNIDPREKKTRRDPDPIGRYRKQVPYKQIENDILGADGLFTMGLLLDVVWILQKLSQDAGFRIEDERREWIVLAFRACEFECMAFFTVFAMRGGNALVLPSEGNKVEYDRGA